MTNDWNGVVAWAKANPTDYGKDWDGRCESLVQDAGEYGTGFLTAHAAYERSHVYTPAQLPIGSVPTGWNLWWDYVAADGTNYGHVAFAAPGGLALMASSFVTASIHTDLGYVARAEYAGRSGHRYLGASPDHGGHYLQGVIHSAAAPAAARTYTVQAGDSLSSIAARFKTTWQHLYALNEKTIGSDPDRIRIGERLAV